MSTDVLMHYSPNLLDHETLERILVQRDALITDIVDRVRTSATTASKHYSLLVGPRGIGKTHLVSLVYHRCRLQADLRDKLCIAWLREEEYGIGSFLDLLIRIFRALAIDDPSLTDRIEPLYQLSPADAERAAGRMLREYLGNRTLLLLAENLDELFSGLEDRGQRALRSYIQERPIWTIVATTQSLFSGISRRTSPFYGFFDIQHLDEFNVDEIVELLSKIAIYQGQQDLADFVSTPGGRARLRAIRHLAGGNPRIYVIFSKFLTKESLDELVAAFISMLDELTPYYQHKMKMLSPQQRKIIEYLCDRGGAVPVKEIALRCFISHQTASSQLADLRKSAYVHSSRPGTLGREVYYELHEPLMRLCIELKKNRGEPIRLFADFLRLWYSRQELSDRLAALRPEDRTERDHIALALSLSRVDWDPRVDACVADQRDYLIAGEFLYALGATEDLAAVVRESPASRAYIPDLSDEIAILVQEAARLANDNSFEQALKVLDNLQSIAPAYGSETGLDLILSRRVITLVDAGRFEEVLEAVRPMSKLTAEARNYLGIAQLQLDRLDEALTTADKLLIDAPDSVFPRRLRASALLRVGRNEEAVSELDLLVNLHPGDAIAWRLRGNTYLAMQRYEDAGRSFDRAISLTSDMNDLYGRLGLCLERTGRLAEAIEPLCNALAFDPTDALAAPLLSNAMNELGVYTVVADALKNVRMQSEEPYGVRFVYADALLGSHRWQEAFSIMAGVSDDERSVLTHISLEYLYSSGLGKGLHPILRDFMMTATQTPAGVSDIARGLVVCIQLMAMEDWPSRFHDDWANAWTELEVQHCEIASSVRLIKTAARYLKDRDVRILLELPLEERTIVEQQLGVSSVMDTDIRAVDSKG